MLKILLPLAILCSELAVGAQGRISFRNSRTGCCRGVFFYGLSSSDPLRELQGYGEDYSDRPKLTGDGYTAGLFIDKEGTWELLGTSIFRTHPSEAGYMQAVGGITVDWVRPGDLVDLVIRVWDTRAGSWDNVIKRENDWMGRGESIPILGYLAGGEREGTSIGQKSLQDAGLQSFGLYVVPEPGTGALSLLAVLLLGFIGRVAR